MFSRHYNKLEYSEINVYSVADELLLLEGEMLDADFPVEYFLLLNDNTDILYPSLFGDYSFTPSLNLYSSFLFITDSYFITCYDQFYIYSSYSLMKLTKFNIKLRFSIFFLCCNVLFFVVSGAIVICWASFPYFLAIFTPFLTMRYSTGYS